MLTEIARDMRKELPFEKLSRDQGCSVTLLIAYAYGNSKRRGITLPAVSVSGFFGKSGSLNRRILQSIFFAFYAKEQISLFGIDKNRYIW